MRILLIEDDIGIAQGLLAMLRQRGHVADGVRSLEQGRTALSLHDWDLLLLDLGLPDGDGLELLARLRQGAGTGTGAAAKRPPRDLPVIILTARDDIGERIAGLNQGADDYLVKPFDIDELQARIHAVLRRMAGRAQSQMAWRDVDIDPVARRVTRAGTPIDLSPREYTLLLTLLQAGGRVLTREHLQERVYGWGEEVASNALEVHVHHLRRKLGPDIIETRRGVGYALAAP